MTRKDSRLDQANYDPNDSGPVVATLMARTSEPAPELRQKADDEKIHVFWRVFGGALLSIGALVAITLYNSLQSSIAELRAEIARLNEVRGDLVRKDEFNARISANYDRLSTLQSQTAGQSSTIVSLKTDLDAQKDRLSKASTDLETLRKEIATGTEGLKKDMVALESAKEKLTLLMSEMKVVREDAIKLKSDLDKNQISDNERKLRRDEQAKEWEKALKDLQTAVQACQVKLARLEGQQQATPPKTKEPANP